MNLTVYILSKLIILLLVFGLVSSIRYGIQHGLHQMGYSVHKQKQLLQIMVLCFVVWLLILCLFFLSGVLQEFNRKPPLLLYLFFPPLLIFWGLLFLPRFQQLLKHIPKSWLFYAQSYRLLTDLCLWLGFAGGFVPKQLTFLWLNQDYTVGATAIIAGYTFFGKKRHRPIEGTIWNIFGLILLFNQVFLGYISLPFDPPILNTGISSIFLTDFPFIWIWGFSIPFGFGLHTASLYQIWFSGRFSQKRTFRLQRKVKI